MAFTLRFNVMGLDQLNRTFSNLSAAVLDLRPPFKQMTTDFYRSQKETFAAEGAYEGKPKWKETSEAYTAWKQRRYGSSQILQASRRLMRAATSKKADGSLYYMTERSLTMGVQINVGGWNLAALHQFGTRLMDKREVIRLSSQQKKRWVRFVRDHFHRAITRA